MSSDIPNAFIQAPFHKKEGEETIFMKIIGLLVGILVGMHPEEYKDFVVYENGKPVLYVEILRALYGMLESALLWCKNFCTDLEADGVAFDNCDPCVANKMMKESQIRQIATKGRICSDISFVFYCMMGQIIEMAPMNIRFRIITRFMDRVMISRVGPCRVASVAARKSWFRVNEKKLFATGSRTLKTQFHPKI